MKWPVKLIIVRHGQSQFNSLKPQKDQDPRYQEFKALYEQCKRKNFAHSANAVGLAQQLQEKYAMGISDERTPLTPTGHKQAYKTGRALSRLLTTPDVVFVSPYLRTQQTLQGIVKGWPRLAGVKTIPDERIRERNIGLLEIYNDWRILNILNPDQGRLQTVQGEFYYRYPQGESIADVQFRNRQWFQTLTREFSGKTVLVVTHHLTLLSIRSLLERWTPKKFIHVDHHEKPRNCSVTIYREDPKQGTDGKLCLEAYNQIFY